MSDEQFIHVMDQSQAALAASEKAIAASKHALNHHMPAIEVGVRNLQERVSELEQALFRTVEGYGWVICNVCGGILFVANDEAPEVRGHNMIGRMDAQKQCPATDISLPASMIGRW